MLLHSSARFMDQLKFIMIFWAGPIQIVIALYMLWQQLGVAAFGGVLVMLLLMPFNAYMARAYTKIQVKVSNLSHPSLGGSRTELLDSLIGDPWSRNN